MNAEHETLRKLAEAATAGPWPVREETGQDEAWCDWHDIGPLSFMGGKLNKDSAYIAAVSPDVILALLDRVEALEGALTLVHRLFLPLHMSLAEAELAGEPIPDSTILFSFMGSGASDHVDVGTFRAALEAARSALHSGASS